MISLYVILASFILNFSANANEAFMIPCLSDYGQDRPTQGNISWLKHSLFKTKDCKRITEKMSQFKSFSQFIPPDNVTKKQNLFSWTDDFPFLYGIYFSNKIIERRDSASTWNIFSKLELYRGFKNLIHMSYTKEYKLFEFYSICKVLKLFPSLKIITIEQELLNDTVSDQCLANSSIDGVIIRGPFSGFKKRPSARIIGFEDYQASFDEIDSYEELRYLGIPNYPSIGNIESLSLKINLTHLSLNTNRLKGITHLGKLFNLAYLSLTCLNIANQPEANCLDDSFIKDPSFISRLSFLRYLNLSYNKLEIFPYYSNLIYLESIQLRGNFIKEIPDISKLKGLKELDMADNQIENIQSLKDLPSLEYLDLSSNKISEFYALNGIETLRFLNISNNIFQKEKLTLNPMKKLVALNLNGSSTDNKLDGIIDFYIFDYLEDEVSEDDKIKIEKIINPKWLNQDRKSFLSSSIKISPSFNVKFLTIRNNSFEEIPNLSILKKTTYLDIENNNIEHFNEKNLPPNLIVLDSSENNITAFPELSKLSKLKKVDLTGNRISSIDKIINLPNKETHIYLGDNQISNIAPLNVPGKTTNLKLELDGNPILACPKSYYYNSDVKLHCMKLFGQKEFYIQMTK
jgi:internalin A